MGRQMYLYLLLSIGGLFIVSADTTISESLLQFSVDDSLVGLYIDALEVPLSSLPNKDTWNVTDKIKVNVSTQICSVIAIAGKNGDQNPAGIVASLTELGTYIYGTTYTDSNWKCSSTAYEGWINVDYDDEDWPAAVEVNDAGKGPYAVINEFKGTPAKWIWTKDFTDNPVYCRVKTGDCNMLYTSRIQCGSSNISPEDCRQQNCCYRYEDVPGAPSTPKCFNKTDSALMLGQIKDRLDKLVNVSSAFATYEKYLYNLQDNNEQLLDLLYSVRATSAQQISELSTEVSKLTGSSKPDNGCPEGWEFNQRENRCYLFVYDASMSEVTAYYDCRTKGGSDGTLVTIMDSGEFDFVVNRMSGEPFWTAGVRDPPDTATKDPKDFKWFILPGKVQPMQYKNWNNDFPDATISWNCVAMDKDGFWNTDCGDDKPYVCKTIPKTKK